LTSSLRASVRNPPNVAKESSTGIWWAGVSTALLLSFSAVPYAAASLTQVSDRGVDVGGSETGDGGRVVATAATLECPSVSAKLDKRWI
jgi:hypothetical protein